MKKSSILTTDILSNLKFAHGGNIYRISEESGIPKERLMDFSASINPLGVSRMVQTEIKKEMKNLHNYPDTDTKELRDKIAEYHGIDPERILCGNGSTELIYLIPRALKPEKVLIPAPTFSEYERACRTTSYKLQVKSYKLRRENNFEINTDEFISAMEGRGSSKRRTPNGSTELAEVSELKCNMAFLCNPNNPTGRLLTKDSVLKIADAAKRLKCYLVVDEAFIDFCPQESVIKHVEDNLYLIVLRSMTKFYALAGLRMGYGVFHQDVAKRIRAFKEPWTVNTLAQRAVIAALSDNAYVDESMKLNKNEKGFLEDGFKELGIKFFPSEANFYLLKINDAGRIYEALKKKGIIVRDCSNFRGLDNSYIRIAVKARRENETLINALRHAMDNLKERG